ncbi:MAG: leucine-rich repeat domain-containing protein [Oscillospiraceae bacterium]|nr:leucine-rich repeat domain-containing protein [Oscillospiraceae bacterium]
MKKYNKFLDNVQVNEDMHAKTIERINRGLSALSEPHLQRRRLRRMSVYAPVVCACAIIGVAAFLTTQGFFMDDNPVTAPVDTTDALNVSSPPYNTNTTRSHDAPANSVTQPQTPDDLLPIDKTAPIGSDAPRPPDTITDTETPTTTATPTPTSTATTTAPSVTAPPTSPPTKPPVTPAPTTETSTTDVPPDVLPPEPIVIVLANMGMDDERLSDMIEGGFISSDVTELDLRGNQLTDVSILEQFTNLQTLVLDNNQIANADALAGLTQLRELSLRNNNIEAFAHLVDGFAESGLEHLVLVDNPVQSSHEYAVITEVFAWAFIRGS